MKTSTFDSSTHKSSSMEPTDYSGSLEELESGKYNEDTIVNVADDDDAPLPVEATPLSEEEMQEKRYNCYKKLILATIFGGIIIFIIVDSLTTGHVSDAVISFLDWIEDHPVEGFFAFLLVYFVATVLFIPGSILTLGAGFAFANEFGLGTGVLLGTLAVFFGASLGATVAFLIGRYLLRDWVANRLSKKYALFEALDVAFSEKGLRIMILLRLSPVIPFNVINYIAGVTSIGFWQFVIAFLAMLPGTILYVFLGASAGSLMDSTKSDDDQTVTILVVVVGIVFGLLALGVTSYYAKKELNKIAQARSDGENEGDADQQEDMKESIDEGHGEIKERDEEIKEVASITA